ncbi:2,3-bisphosphoglycerate-independent phosphoglycerate mutase [Patescibacteria group bacterium]
MTNNAITTKYKPVVLIILDGFGIAPPSRGNAITRAKIPTIDMLISSYPTMTIQPSGESVGLPWGEVGNSEVGHLNIGAGKIVYQDLPRITNAISTGAFFRNTYFLKAIDQTIKSKGKSNMHIIGLISSGGVHSSLEHLFAILELMKKEGLEQVYIHVILDGRDTPYNSGINFVKKLQNKISEIGIGKIVSLCGRFYAMDRDNHWERIEKAYNVMIGNIESVETEKFTDAVEAIEQSYRKKIYDEEFEPIALYDDNGALICPIKNSDSVIFFNYRSDRARELTKVFVLPSFQKFSRKEYFKDLMFICMTEYDKSLPALVAFPPELIVNPIAKVISDAGLKQLHIAETEKYAHVTFFLNGGVEKEFEGEDRILVPSPRIESYDKKPEMSAKDITSNVIKEINKETYDFIVINFANPDMVGHTGKINATIKSVEAVDKCLKKIVNNVIAKNGALIVTADHGNSECMVDMQTGSIDKEHTTNPVPFIIVSNELEGKNSGKEDNISNDLSILTPSGILADVAPTVLKLMQLEKPAEMTGQSLI